MGRSRSRSRDRHYGRSREKDRHRHVKEEVADDSGRRHRSHRSRDPSHSPSRRRRREERSRSREKRSHSRRNALSREPERDREREGSHGRRREGSERRGHDRYGLEQRAEKRKVKTEPTSDSDERERRMNDQKRIEHRRRRDAENSNPLAADAADAKFAWGKLEHNVDNQEDNPDEEKNQQPKEKPDFGLSGKLAADTNTFNGVVVTYNEPAEARKPKVRWRLYPFKGEESLPVLYIHRQSAYLVGRDRRCADVPVDHPSCSKQHAVLQYRAVKYDRGDGSKGTRIRPYIIDLNSANGTFLNNNKLEPQRYVELQEKDVIKFGFSSREYVILNENSKQSSGEESASETIETN